MTAPDSHKALRDDVSMLGEMLGETLRARGAPELFSTVERIRRIAIEARQQEAHALPALEAPLRALPLDLAVPVARAFSHFLTLANIAEQHHRVRRRREYLRDGSAGPQPGSFAETFARLLAAGVAPDAVHDAVSSARIELVLTAHPTAITRRTLAAAHVRIADALARQDRADLTAVERAGIDADLRREILTMWGTEDVRPTRPSPMEEVRSGLFIFEQTLWDAVPRYARALDRALRDATGRGLPLDAAPIAFGSWIGGDRDGNPAITPEVTLQACLEARQLARTLYLKDLTALHAELSVTDASDELRARAQDAREPYRAVLRDLHRALRSARRSDAAVDLRGPLELCHRSLVSTGQGLLADARLTDVLRRVAAFGSSLVTLDVRQHANRHTAAIDFIARAGGAGPYGEWSEAERQQFLHRAIRDRVPIPDLTPPDPDVRDVLGTFRALAQIPAESLGAYVVSMTQAPSDVLAVEYLQQQFGVHLRVVPLFEEVATLERAGDTVREILAARYGPAGLKTRPTAAPADADDARRGPAGLKTRPTTAPADADTDDARDGAAGLKTRPTATRTDADPDDARDRPAALKTRPTATRTDADLDDARDGPAGLKTCATTTPADAAADTADADAQGARAIEIMIGYSDSAKDGGRLAANWQLYKAQEDVVAAARDAGVPLTLFHGRGGSIGRGGGPTHLAMQSQPPGSIDGRLRVTVQGEMIQAQFGLHDVALRTLEVYTTSVLEATLAPPPAVPPEWRSAMDRLASTAHRVYRQVVYDDPRFIEYFRTATPEREIGLAPIGSRPARRGGDGGVASLRAIPWVFAWTQTRLLLPSWLGTGEALSAAFDRGERDAIRAMARDWPFFDATLRLIEMALAEADPAIAAAYDRDLVPDTLKDVGGDLRARLDVARRTVLDALAADTLLAGNPMLRRSIDVRNPYVDPINIVQIALLGRLRGADVVTRELWQAFLVTVNGIAAGMRNVG